MMMALNWTMILYGAAFACGVGLFLVAFSRYKGKPVNYKNLAAMSVFFVVYFALLTLKTVLPADMQFNTGTCIFLLCIGIGMLLQKYKVQYGIPIGLVLGLVSYFLALYTLPILSVDTLQIVGTVSRIMFGIWIFGRLIWFFWFRKKNKKGK